MAWPSLAMTAMPVSSQYQGLIERMCFCVSGTVAPPDRPVAVMPKEG